MMSYIAIEPVNNYSYLEYVEAIKIGRNNNRFVVEQPFTPTKLIEEITNQLCIAKTAKIAVLYTIEWAVYLKGKGYTDITIITQYDDPAIQKICVRMGLEYILLEEVIKDNMRFDALVGNPPYQDKTGMENTTTSADLASIFVQKGFELSDIVALVIPSDWTGPNASRLKNFLFKENTLKQLSFYGDKWFDVKKDTCSFIYDKNYTGLTYVTDITGATDSFNLSQYNVLSLTNTESKLSNKFDTTNSLADRWLHGSLNLHRAHALKGNHYEFICATGRKDQPTDTITIAESSDVVGFGIHKLVMAMVGASGKLGPVKIAGVNQVGGHSVVFLTANSAEELVNLQNYLDSKVVKFLIKSVKKSTPNSKGIFSQVPNIDTTRSWSDADLYAHFSLTKDEITYIEANVK